MSTQQKEIIEMARQAGVDMSLGEHWSFFIEELEAFAKLVADKAAEREREACATVCDRLLANPNTGGGWSDATIECSVQIRARGAT